MADVLLIAVIVRRWTAPGARGASYLLLVSALGMTLAADIAGGLMLPAVTLVIDGALGNAVLWQVIGLGALLISVLVLVLVLVLMRMSGILRTVEVQAVQLAELARSDSLTGAPNRRTWDHELSRVCTASLEHNTALCVAMMDIDHFKIYHDTYGHQAGDRLLREAVAAWTEQLRDGEFLARYGGEEFTVLLPGLTLAQAQARIQTLSAVTPDGQTFSAGVSTWDPGTEPASAVAAADEALYVAKRSGRDRVLTAGSSTWGRSSSVRTSDHSKASPGSVDSTDGSRRS